MQLTEYEKKSLLKLNKAIIEGQWSNNGLVELIKLEGQYLNLMTIPDYSAAHKISYPAAQKSTRQRKNEKLFNTKYIIDND